MLCAVLCTVSEHAALIVNSQSHMHRICISIKWVNKYTKKKETMEESSETNNIIFFSIFSCGIIWNCQCLILADVARIEFENRSFVGTPTLAYLRYILGTKVFLHIFLTWQFSVLTIFCSFLFHSQSCITFLVSMNRQKVMEIIRRRKKKEHQKIITLAELNIFKLKILKRIRFR